MFQSSRIMMLWLHPLKSVSNTQTSSTVKQHDIIPTVQSLLDKIQEAIYSSLNIVKSYSLHHPYCNSDNSEINIINWLLQGSENGESDVTLKTPSLTLLEEAILCENDVILSQILDILFLTRGLSSKIFKEANWNQSLTDNDYGIDVPFMSPPSAFVSTFQEAMKYKGPFRDTRHKIQSAST